MKVLVILLGLLFVSQAAVAEDRKLSKEDEARLKKYGDLMEQISLRNEIGEMLREFKTLGSFSIPSAREKTIGLLTSRGYSQVSSLGFDSGNQSELTNESVIQGNRQILKTTKYCKEASADICFSIDEEQNTSSSMIVR